MTSGTALIALATTPIEGAQVPTVDARELHAFLKAGRDLTTWIREPALLRRASGVTGAGRTPRSALALCDESARPRRSR